LVIEDGRAVKVEGDPDHPISRGRLCARGRLLVDHLYHPARLNYPLKRLGERGANQWQRLSWDQALDNDAAQRTPKGRCEKIGGTGCVLILLLSF
jgi:anaerobic selenocysteine-containing dehydrogenase